MNKQFNNINLTTGFSGKDRTDLIIKFINKFLKFKKLNLIYHQHKNKYGLEFIDALLKELDIKLVFDENELKKIPKKGPFIVISNFPIGGLEGLFLLRMILPLREDFKILSNKGFAVIDEFKDFVIPLEKQKIRKGKTGIKISEDLKQIFEHFKKGGGLGIFPANRAATFNPKYNKVVDIKWNKKIIKLIKVAKVPIIPVFINDSNRVLYHLLGILHPILQTFLLQNELLKKKEKQINIRIGSPITVAEQEKLNFDLDKFGRFLRAKVYALGNHLEVNNFFRKRKLKLKQPEPIIPPIDKQAIKKEIQRAKENDYLLFSNGSFDLICAPADEIPDVLMEIGRLREITFREVGEGTNKSVDIDEFDLYYHHLIIWDNEKEQIVGSYRFGRGDEIMQRFGVKGFYISTLFKIKKQMYPILEKTLELGRSFVVKEYQRKPLSLFMLWKGILYYLLKNPNYRYLIGPVSISGTFSEMSKALIAKFFETYYYEDKLAKYVKPKRKFKTTIPKENIDILLENIGNDINKLDRLIKEIDNGKRLPVLFKKYMSLNAKMLAFNIDPDFNYCLDGLMILDIAEVPIDMIKALAKELNNEKLLEQLNFN